MNKSVYFITGGGTGGHIYPALAVADFLVNDKNNTIYYVGNPDNLEYEITKSKPYKFLPVKISGMPRKFSFKFILWVWQLCCATLKALCYLRKYKPKLVFGTGGYVSAPCLIGAKLLHIPFVMHDCDSNPGLVTRILAKYAKSVSLAFDVAKSSIKNDNCYINGNPIRTSFKTLTKEDARKNLGLRNKLTICIMGGSQGANSINSATVEILKKLSLEYDVQVIFQTGKKKFDAIEKSLAEIYPEYKADKNLLVRPYFDDMVSVLKASDIAVSRAGSLSISELCASSVATIFVPYPYAAADHQRKNAKIMAEQGAGLYIEDSELTSQKLLEMVERLITNSEILENLQRNTRSLAKYDGVEKIVQQILINT